MPPLVPKIRTVQVIPGSGALGSTASSADVKLGLMPFLKEAFKNKLEQDADRALSDQVVPEYNRIIEREIRSGHGRTDLPKLSAGVPADIAVDALTDFLKLKQKAEADRRSEARVGEAIEKGTFMIQAARQGSGRAQPPVPEVESTTAGSMFTSIGPRQPSTTAPKSPSPLEGIGALVPTEPGSVRGNFDPETLANIPQEMLTETDLRVAQMQFPAIKQSEVPGSLIAEASRRGDLTPRLVPVPLRQAIRDGTRMLAAQYPDLAGAFDKTNAFAAIREESLNKTLLENGININNEEMKNLTPEKRDFVASNPHIVQRDTNGNVSNWDEVNRAFYAFEDRQARKEQELLKERPLDRDKILDKATEIYRKKINDPIISSARISTGYANIMQAMYALQKANPAAGPVADQVMIIAAMKAIEPDSAVLSAEFARTEEYKGLKNKINSLLPALLGQGFAGDEIRDALVQSVTSLAQVHRRAAGPLVSPLESYMDALLEHQDRSNNPNLFTAVEEMLQPDKLLGSFKPFSKKTTDEIMKIATDAVSAQQFSSEARREQVLKATAIKLMNKLQLEKALNEGKL